MMDFRGNYLNGRWVLPSPGQTVVKKNPGDRSDILLCWSWAADAVEEAVSAAHNACGPWRALSLEKRIQHVQALAEVFVKEKDAFARCIALETGKPLWEAETEANALASKIQITIRDGLPRLRERNIPDALPGMTGHWCHRPLGVVAVLGPYNFPAHLPNGQIIPALLSGNTVVFKPSEMTPATGQLYASCFAQADFPPGVCNLLQGPASVGASLVKHENIHGVWFTGSHAGGLAIRRATVAQTWKLVALEMGGDNPVLVMDDAPLAKAAADAVYGAYLSCGQRCSATRRVLVHESRFKAFCDIFLHLMEGLTIGFALDGVENSKSVPFMGPVTGDKARRAVQRYRQKFLADRFRLLGRGRLPADLPDGAYVAPQLVHATKQQLASSVMQHERFGPDVVVTGIHDFDEGVLLANQTGYGLSASVFTMDESIAREFQRRVAAGVVNWNAPTVGASARLPFGGVGKSGNHRPAGVTAVDWCVFVQSGLDGDPEWNRENAPPGFPDPDSPPAMTTVV